MAGRTAQQKREDRYNAAKDSFIPDMKKALAKSDQTKAKPTPSDGAYKDPTALGRNYVKSPGAFDAVDRVETEASKNQKAYADPSKQGITATPSNPKGPGYGYTSGKK